MFDGEDAGGSGTRRDFFRAAVAVGGTAALSACLGRLGGDGGSPPDEPVPRGVEDPSTLPDRQHAWNDRCRTDEHGNVLLPRHQLFLYLTLDGDGPPTAADRRAVEGALRTLDRAYERSNEGLLSSIAYSPRYFDRFDEPLTVPPLPEPRALSNLETPTLDRQDALLHLASDRPDALLEAEAALTGERDTANAVAVEAPLTDVLAVADRRAGFVGAGLPAARAEGLAGVPDPDAVPDASPLFMGFKAGFAGNQASEEYVTLREGPFAGGTTKHVSRLRQRLDDWYGEQSYDERVAELFSPRHAAEGLVEGVGANLGADSGVTDVDAAEIREQAEAFGRVGHAQKAARANRDADGNVKLLRRHCESDDDGVASLHFPSLQRRIADFEAVREAMNGADLTDVPTIRQRVNNGILEYVFVRNRGNFLVPPRPLRALPTPGGDVPGLDVG
jgi:hypothetical protein